MTSGASSGRIKLRCLRCFPKCLCVIFASLLLLSPFLLFQVEATATPFVQTVDSSGWVGLYASLALDSCGRAGISYYYSTNNDLKYAAWTGSNWNVQTVDSAGFVGLHTSIAFDSSDYPHISYDGENSLRYASWNGTGWNIQSVDSVGSFTSLAIDRNGNPHISYFHIASRGTLKYASWTGSSWSNETVDSAQLVGEFTSLALDHDGNPHISYYDIPNGDLKYAWRDSSGWDIQTVDSEGDVGQYTSIALDSNGNAHISYCDASNGDLKYAQSDGASWRIEVVDSAGNVGTDSSLALDSGGKPHISYTDNTNHYLKYASWNGSGWNIQTLSSAGYVGEYTSLSIDWTSLEIDRNDSAHIAFCDVSRYILKYAILGNSPSPPTHSVSTIASLSAKPNQVSVGKPVSIQMSIAPPPPTPTDRFNGLVLSIMKPDRTLGILGPFLTETNGLLSTYYTPTQIGNYTLQLNYYGQLFLSGNTTYLPSQSGLVTLSVQQQSVPRTWTVDDNGPADFSSIQAAVDAALPGDTVFVRDGIYKEPQVTIFRKTLSVVGEDNTTTIIDGDSGHGSIYGARIYVQNATDVVVRGFTIRNGGGIYSAFSKNVLITENIVTGCPQGIVLMGTTDATISRNVLSYNNLSLLLSSGSNNNTISDNFFTRNNGTGIGLDHSDRNIIERNVVYENGLGSIPQYHASGVRLFYSNSNSIFHNDIISNFEQAYCWVSVNNVWDNGYPSGGNYWRDYNGTDYDHDGIGETPYAIDADNVDRYPLMKEFMANQPPPNPPLTHGVPTSASLSAKPNPIGVGQMVMINMSVTPRPPTPNERFKGLTLTITRPDGRVHTLGPFLSDTDGWLTTYYMTEQVGTYRIQLSFPGQVFTSGNTTYLPSQSPAITLTAQQEPVPLSASSTSAASPSSSTSPSPNSNSACAQPQNQNPEELPLQQGLDHNTGINTASAPTPLPITWTAWATAIIAVVALLIVYFKKRGYSV